MAKNIGATITLKDGGFQSGIKSAVSSLKSFKSGTESSTSSLKKMNSQTNAIGQSLGGLVKKIAGTAAAYIGFNQAKDFLTDCVTGVMELERANTRLETLMMNVDGTTKAQVQDLIEYGDALELVTTIEGDAAMAGASQLATFQLSADTIKTLMPAFEDLAVAQYGVNVSQEQMINSGNLIGKVMNGSVGALTKAGVSFTSAQEQILKTGTESEKAAALVEVLGKNFGGLAQQMAQTDEGRTIRLKNAWGSVKDEIGSAVLPAVSSFVQYTAEHIPQIRDAVTNAMQNISSASETVIPDIIGMLEKAADAVGFVVENWDELSPVIYGVVGAIGAYKGIVAACNIVEQISVNYLKIKKVIMGVLKPIIAAVQAAHLALASGEGIATAAQWALNAAMDANPVGVIIVAIGALIAIGVLLYKNWDSISAFFVSMWGKIKDGAAACWGGIKTAFAGVAEFFGNIFTNAWNMVTNAFSGVVGFFQNIWDTIKSMFTSIGTAIADGVSGAFKSVINGVISFAGNLINNFIKSINWAINVINDIPGVSINKLSEVNLPMLANGGVIQRPGNVIVGERGPEILSLPRGAQVTPLDKTGSTNHNEFHITIHAENKSVSQIVDELVPRLKLALSNM